MNQSQSTVLIENPYQYPATDFAGARSPLENRDYPSDKCPYCESKVTFWRLIWQFMPLRYTCSRCGQKYKMLAPWLGLITFAPAIILIPVVLGSLFGLHMSEDPRFAGAAGAAWTLGISLSAISIRYFLRRGHLVPYQIQK